MRDQLKRAAILVVGMLFLGAVFAACYAPFLYGELAVWLEPHSVVDPAPARVVKGRMVDDYFAVENLGDGTFAIGEPRYYQQNYSYLIVGATRAVLFDSGSGTRDISGIVAGLTTPPTTVIVSHLHFDHFGGIGPFGSGRRMAHAWRDHGSWRSVPASSVHTGTYYSSAILVKLDRALIARVHTSARSAAIARALVGLCHNIGLEVNG